MTFFLYNKYDILIVGSDTVIYLDYSATTPISFEALDTYTKISKEYIGSINSNNLLSQKSKDLLKKTKFR